MAKSEKTFDPRSETVVLEYRGGADGEPHLLGIPSRDLTEADVCRLVYARAVNEYDGTPDGPPMPDPEKPSQAKARELVELLLSRQVDGKSVYGLAKATKRDVDTNTPATPADEPEA